MYFVPGTEENSHIFCAKADLHTLLYSYIPTDVKLQMTHIIRVSPDKKFIYVGETTKNARGRVLQVRFHNCRGSFKVISAVNILISSLRFMVRMLMGYRSRKICLRVHCLLKVY